MEPIKLRIDRIIDFGAIVSIVGVDTSSQEPVVVHVDHRPFKAIWETWQAAGFCNQVTFDADLLTLSLAIDRDQRGQSETETNSAPAA